MAVITRDYTRTTVPDIDKGVPHGRGFLHSLLYHSLCQVAVNDRMVVQIKVPNDEHWYILQWQVLDSTGLTSFPNGWKEMHLGYNLETSQSPVASTADPTPSGSFGNPVVLPGDGVNVWGRWWDGATPIYWDESVIFGMAPKSAIVVTRCTDPVWSMARVRPGTQMNLVCSGAQSAGLVNSIFQWNITVVRFKLEDFDFQNLVQLSGPGVVALNDLHIQQHRPALGN